MTFSSDYQANLDTALIEESHRRRPLFQAGAIVTAQSYLSEAFWDCFTADARKYLGRRLYALAAAGKVPLRFHAVRRSPRCNEYVVL